MLTPIRFAVKRRIGSQGRTIINDNSICYALSDDGDIHTADQTPMIVKKIDIRPPKTLWDKDGALIRLQDEIDNIWIGDGDLSEWTLAADGR
jgi:hypothetical protein